MVTETDLLAVLSQMGFRGFDEPLKTYLRECEADDRVRALIPLLFMPVYPAHQLPLVCSQSSKRLRTTPTQEGQGAAVADAAGSANAGVAKGAGLADGGVNAAPVVRSAEAEVSAAIPERAGLVHVGMSTAEGAGSADAGVTAAEMKGADCSADAGVNTAATEGAAGSAETRMDAATKSS